MGYIRDVSSKVNYVLHSIQEIRKNGKNWKFGGVYSTLIYFGV